MTYRNTTALAAVLSTFVAGHALAEGHGAALLAQDWDAIVEQARGGEVNWFLWGGADNINRYVSEYVAGILMDEYGITLHRIGMTDTVEAVNIVLGEREAGVMADGAVDMIWINGENFRTMVQGDLVFCGYTDILPNNALINWGNPAIANDFGVPVNGCEVPWSRAQFAFAYDTARTENPPRSIPELIDWVAANPGLFTYPAPPDFTGSVFVRHVFYHAAGGVENLLGPFDQALFDKVAPRAWEILNAMEPNLWRAGRTYPTSLNALQELFANSEVDLYFSYEPSSFGTAVDDGVFADSVRSYGLSDGTIGNTNYTIIPFNSPNKAAALVLQNVLLSGEAQLEKARPEVWGATAAIEIDRLDAALQAGFAELPSHPSVVSMAELGENALPELQADWITAIEQGWIENVGR